MSFYITKYRNDKRGVAEVRKMEARKKHREIRRDRDVLKVDWSSR